MWVCVLYTWVQCLWRPESISSPGAKVTSRCNCPIWVLGTDLSSSARVESALNSWAISPAPKDKSLYRASPLYSQKSILQFQFSRGNNQGPHTLTGSRQLLKFFFNMEPGIHCSALLLATTNLLVFHVLKKTCLHRAQSYSQT